MDQNMTDIESEELGVNGMEDGDLKEIATKEPLLRKRMNTTSQIAMIGANVCSIESLDYE